MDFALKMVVFEVEGFFQAVLAAPFGKCRLKCKALDLNVDQVLGGTALPGKQNSGEHSSRLNGVHHAAFATWNPNETVEFHRDMKRLQLCHAITAGGWGARTGTMNDKFGGEKT
ncbi:MAG: hypothetical protein V3S29_11080 [bacterium]